jgi:hypothetical protein
MGAGFGFGNESVTLKGWAIFVGRVVLISI